MTNFILFNVGQNVIKDIIQSVETVGSTLIGVSSINVDKIRDSMFHKLIDDSVHYKSYYEVKQHILQAQKYTDYKKMYRQYVQKYN